jgi:hypothetical protein
MRTSLLLSLVVALPLVGCAHHHERARAQHPELAPQGGLQAFHDVLGPVYHEAPGASRDEQTCAAAAKLKAAASAVVAESTSDADRATGEALAQSVDALATACQAADRAEVGSRLEAVHDAFHAVMEARPSI